MSKEKIIKIFSYVWFPLGLFLLLSSFYFLTHQDNTNSITPENIETMKKDFFNGDTNGYIEFDITQNIGSMCNETKNKFYTVAWILLIYLIFNDFLLYINQFISSDKIKWFIEYNKVLQITLCLMFFISYIFVYANAY